MLMFLLIVVASLLVTHCQIAVIFCVRKLEMGRSSVNTDFITLHQNFGNLESSEKHSAKVWHSARWRWHLRLISNARMSVCSACGLCLTVVIICWLVVYLCLCVWIIMSVISLYILDVVFVVERLLILLSTYNKITNSLK